jgi:hypothetical protein
MTFLNILLYVALIGYVLFKKIQGRPIRAPRKLFGLPIVLIVLGFGDLTSGKTMKPVEIALTVIGAILSIGLGLMRGRADQISTRDGTPFVQWGKVSLILFGVNIVAKLVLDLIGVAAGGSGSAAGKSLIFTLGLNLLAEAGVLWMRSGAGATPLNSRPATTAMNDQTGRPAWSPGGIEQNDTGNSPQQPINQPEARSASETAVSRGLAAAIGHHQNHHERHRNRHEYKHNHGQRHERERS